MENISRQYCNHFREVKQINLNLLEEKRQLAQQIKNHLKNSMGKCFKFYTYINTDDDFITPDYMCVEGIDNEDYIKGKQIIETRNESFSSKSYWVDTEGQLSLENIMYFEEITKEEFNQKLQEIVNYMKII